ncbi:uncharacterized protein LOC125809870 [Solanum verrucosum]|uniref:uncharacterized protein LOC125809870 n=1 Tax=Solanum verrucosum TaxID=315347 RepID=UPI0020D0C17E|nr:uncharacterized protein LOC125809870 [Solanum verrucosum]
MDEVYKIVDVMGVTSREKAELASYQLKDVAQVWFTQWKSNRPVEVGPIKWEEFKGGFLGKYFPHEKRECKIEEFINLRQGNMSVEEYSLNFTLFSKYAPSLSIVESKLKRVNRDLKRGRSDEQGQPRFKKIAPNQDSSSASKANKGKGGGSQLFKPLCATCGKRHHGKCLAGTSGCYGCGKSDHQVRNCPTLTTRGMEAKQAPYVGRDPNAPKKNRFYVLQANKDKGANLDEGTGYEYKKDARKESGRGSGE